MTKPYLCITKQFKPTKIFTKHITNLGNIYLQDGRPNMAIEQYKKVIKLRPEYAYAHYNLACAYIKLGKFGKAKYELLTAIDLKNTVAISTTTLLMYTSNKKKKNKQRYI